MSLGHVSRGVLKTRPRRVLPRAPPHPASPRPVTCTEVLFSLRFRHKSQYLFGCRINQLGIFIFSQFKLCFVTKIIVVECILTVIGTILCNVRFMRFVTWIYFIVCYKPTVGLKYSAKILFAFCSGLCECLCFSAIENKWLIGYVFDTKSDALLEYIDD